MLIAGALCGFAAVVCAVSGLRSLLRPLAGVAKVATRSLAPMQLAAAVMLAAGGAVALSAQRSVAVALLSMCVVGALGTIAAGSWQSARYALRREAGTCGGDCAACTLSCR